MFNGFISFLKPCGALVWFFYGCSVCDNKCDSTGSDVVGKKRVKTIIKQVKTESTRSANLSALNYYLWTPILIWPTIIMHVTHKSITMYMYYIQLYYEIISHRRYIYLNSYHSSPFSINVIPLTQLMKIWCSRRGQGLYQAIRNK